MFVFTISHSFCQGDGRKGLDCTWRIGNVIMKDVIRSMPNNLNIIHGSVGSEEEEKIASLGSLA
jgi:hypothetical protein